MGRVQNAGWQAAIKNPDALMAAITNHVAEGKGLLSWTKQNAVSYATVWNWVNSDPQRERAYNAARVVAADYLFDEALKIIDAEPERLESGGVDNASVTLQRARFDARRWIVAKMMPSRYGESLKVETDAGISVIQALTEARQRVIDMGSISPVMQALNAPEYPRSPTDV
jgi:hypothetical protein